MLPADTALEQFSMAVPHHVRLELRLVGELDPAHAADQSFPGSQRLYVLLEIHIFVQIHLLLDRGATPPLLPPLVSLPPRLVLVSIVNVELVVSREILDLVQHLGLDFHLDEPRDEVKGERGKREEWIGYDFRIMIPPWTRDFAKGVACLVSLDIYRGTLDNFAAFFRDEMSVSLMYWRLGLKIT